MPSIRTLSLCAGVLLIAAGAAHGADTRGAVELTGAGLVPQSPALPKLNLDDAKREQLRQALSTTNSDIEFRLKATKPAKDFTPRVGAKLPKGVKPLGIPSALTQKIPALADYGYDKMKGDILVVNAMTGTIAAIVPETPPQTSGQR
jgi:hypothetical protein